MKIFLKIFLIVIMSAVLILPNLVLAQDLTDVYLTIFYGDGCPHCHNELLFLEKLQAEFSNLKIRKLEVWSDKDNLEVMKDAVRKFNLTTTNVPLTIIGSEVITGYLNDETTGSRIRKIVEKHSATGCQDTVGEIMGLDVSQGDVVCDQDQESKNITLPVFGQINTATWSLPLLTMAIAAVDGFNPCAMWILLFLISLLLGMEDKKKMWILGSTFIIVSALAYFLFLAAWLNLFLFLGFIRVIRVVIGLVAIGSGGYHLKSYWQNRDGSCEVVDDEKRAKIIDRLRKITEQKFFWLAVLGIVGLAFAVNLIELVCSAGLPAIYTQILALAKLSTPGYYLYLLLYIFIFTLDDLLVFIIAMTTLQAVGISSKYTRWSNLIGGIIIFILGILLIFKPGWVMFG